MQESTKALSYAEFFPELKRKRPDIINFYVQRREPPDSHLLHLCLKIDTGAKWVTVPLNTTQRALDNIEIWLD